MSLVGDRVNSVRVPYLGRNLGRADTGEGRFWKRIVDRVLRRPALSLTLSVGAMLVLALPIFGLHIGANGVSTLPSSLPSKQGYVLLQRAFPVQNPEPVRIVAVGGDPTAVHGDLVTARTPAGGRGKLRRGPRSRRQRRRASGCLPSPVRGDPVGGAAISAVRDLRANVIPSIFAGSGAKVYVGGTTAENVDYFDAVTNPTPYVLLFVLGLSFILLTVAFRSIVIALVSVLLNLLSVGAAYGCSRSSSSTATARAVRLPAHARDRRLGAAVPVLGPVRAFDGLPGVPDEPDQGALRRVRIDEGCCRVGRQLDGADHHRRGADHRRRLRRLRRRQARDVRADGFGVAIALLLDATVIRSVVLPSTLVLLDRLSWYLPSWLEWLPHVEVEAPPTPGPADAAIV